MVYKKISNKLKRVISLGTAVVLAFSFAGCGSTGEEASGTVVENEESMDISITHYELPSEAEESDIYVEAIPNLADDFIRGMDVSSVHVEENSGVKYYDFDGNEADVFETLAKAGVNYARIRVWNDPFDEEGNGYGGGNNDVKTAVALGRRATAVGMNVCIDFHYSDFWADPKKQMAPKAWEDLDVEKKAEALADFTKESLQELLDAGVNVTLVQVGNEINTGLSGETKQENVNKLLEAGTSAVREVSEANNKDIQIALHYTNIEVENSMTGVAKILQDANIDYDIFGISYYPYWHGTIENMQKVVKDIQEKYGKKVAVMETSFPYTREDGDGSSNSYDGLEEMPAGYAATMQSQATMLRDISAAANEAGALGVFYWEGCWIPVGSNGSQNKSLWEEYGSGWASSYASDYDPEDAGKYYGGCSWDNQAMFDFEGNPLQSLNVFKYLKYGTITPEQVDFVEDIEITSSLGGELNLPDEVEAVFNNRALNKMVSVSWNENDISKIDVNKAGTYEVRGVLDASLKNDSESLEEGKEEIEQNDNSVGIDNRENNLEVKCIINIENVNFVGNASFEDEDLSMWEVSYEGSSNPTDFLNKSADAHSGDISFHYWSEDEQEFSIEQTLSDLPEGTYELSVFAQGGDVDDDSVMELYAITNDGEYTQNFMVTSYADWQNPKISDISVTDGSITIGVRIKCNALGWGTVDDFQLNLIK